jgi:hypothetical protein
VQNENNFKEGDDVRIKRSKGKGEKPTGRGNGKEF